MKKFVFLFILLCLFITGCENKNEKKSPNNEEYCIVNFDSDGGTRVNSQKVLSGKQISIPDAPIKEGYTFEGWYLGDEKWSFVSNVVTVNLNLIAHWKINQYTLTIKFNDGITSDKLITQDYNTVIDMCIPQPLREGYSFVKWSETVIVMPAKNITIEAIWEHDNIRYTVQDNEAIAEGLMDDVEELVINSTYGGYKITSIGDRAFSNCTSLRSIIIPDTVVSIGAYAFSGCSSLSNVIIPDSVINISEHAFDSCTSLKNIELPNNIKCLKDDIFCNCISLTSITIPDSVLDIFGAFAFCSSLSNVVISTGVRTIIGAFRACTSLVSFTIPDGVIDISGAFSGCSSLNSVIIPNSVTDISGAFFRCTSLTNITLPNNITTIGDSTFSGCENLTSIIIPNKVTLIGDYAFDSCTSLTSIIIPDRVTQIGWYAFSRCTSLTSITLPDSITTIGDQAFNNCELLININYYGSKEQWHNVDKVYNWNNCTGNYIIHCTDGDINK